MGKTTGFMEFERKDETYAPVADRIQNYKEFTKPLKPSELKDQGARCMDCGTPFCQTHTGCPVHNLIPEWNNLVFNQQWREDIDRLHSTNNFPEFTRRVCPAPCEGSCVAGLVDMPVTIKNIEYSIVDKAWK